MHHYLTHLLADLEQAVLQPVPELDFGDSYDDFEAIIFQIEEGRLLPSKQLLNVSYEELPPADRLGSEQISLLLIAILKALLAKGTMVAIPGGDKAPVELVYTEIRKMFIEGFHTMPGWTIDFCSGYCPDCAFKNYCDSYDEEMWVGE